MTNERTALMQRTAWIVAAAEFVAIGLLTIVMTTGCARPGPGTAKTTEDLLGQLQKDRTEIDTTSDTMMKRIDMFNASRKPGDRTVQFSEVFAQDLDPQQKDVLDQMVQEEKDVSYKSLLTNIISDRDQIRQLQEKMLHLQQSLPDTFVVAKRGDKHHELALNYLTGQAGVDAQHAKTLLSQVDQSDELVPGNQVWFFYDKDKDTFRTYVTRGDARMTPAVVRRQKTKALVAERDTYRTQRDSAEQTAGELAQQKAQLENDIDVAKNSIHYHAATDDELKASGVLSPVLKKVQTTKGLTFDNALDLRTGQTITLDPKSFGLAEIRSLRLIPSIYKEGKDFNVETADDGSARLVILDPEAFRGKEVVVAVKG
jgi:hypothetical protein